MEYEEALLKVKSFLVTRSDQQAVESSVKALAWLITEQESGAKFVIVNEERIEAFRFKEDGSITH